MYIDPTFVPPEQIRALENKNMESKEIGMWFDEPLYWLVEFNFETGQPAEKITTDEHIIIYRMEDKEEQVFKRGDRAISGGFFSFKEMQARIQGKMKQLNNYNNEIYKRKRR